MDNLPLTRIASLITIDTEDGPIEGLAYACNFRAEEEDGIVSLSDLFRASSGPDTFVRELAETDPTFRPNGKTQSEFIIDDQQYVGFRAEDIPVSDHSIKSGLKYLPGEIFRCRTGSSEWVLKNKRVPELREIAKSHGISPIPSRKADIIAAIIDSVHSTSWESDYTPAYFNYGDVLMVPRGIGTEFDAFLDQLIEAAKAGALIVGFPYDDPSRTGMVLSDSREWGLNTRAKVLKSFTEYGERKQKALQIKKLLTESGDHVIGLNPTDARDRYYARINLGGGTTVKGYFSEDDLLSGAHRQGA